MTLQIQDMTSIISSHHFKWSLGIGNHLYKGRFHKITYLPSKRLTSFQNQNLSGIYYCFRRCWPIFSSSIDDEKEPDDSEEDKTSEEELPEAKIDGVCVVSPFEVNNFFCCSKIWTQTRTLKFKNYMLIWQFPMWIWCMNRLTLLQ